MTRSRLPALDLFRLGAAVLVVAIHTSPLESFSPDLDFWLTRVAAKSGCSVLSDGQRIFPCEERPGRHRTFF